MAAVSTPGTRMRSGCTEVRAVAQVLYAKNAMTGVMTVLQPD